MGSKLPRHRKIKNIELLEEKLGIRKALLVKDVLENSMNPSDLIKANQVLNVENRVDNSRKSYIIDPFEFQTFMGYKDKPYSLSYNMIRRVSYAAPIIRAIIMTRIDQITAFCEPQKDKYSTGFVVRKKQIIQTREKQKLTKDEEYTIEAITKFILQCGINNSFEADGFDTFIRKIMNDSLTFDQLSFEIVHDRRGRPVEFYALDGSTIRTTDSYDVDHYEAQDTDTQRMERRNKIMGYYPTHCQIYNSEITAEFYPWELCMGVRNPTSSIYANGYGVSEIEMLTNVITSMLWSDEYNRRFFSQGSAPKGFFKVKQGSTLSNNKVTDFKQQWQAMMANVHNSHKTPVLEGDIDWIDLQHNNRDMEFSAWQEYLIKLSASIFRIDPSEIGFPMSGSADAKPMFEGNNEARLKHSKDKGLRPLLKFVERMLNKHLINRINPNFEFVFTGMGVESPSEELDVDIKMLENFMTVDEIRQKRGLKPIGEDNGGNVILNATLNQQLMSQQQGGDEEGMGDEDIQNFDNGGDEEEEEENPFEKAFNNYMEQELTI